MRRVEVLTRWTRRSWIWLLLAGVVVGFGPQAVEAQPFTFTQITNTTGGFNQSPSINATGTRIAFVSSSDLTPGSPGNADGNGEIYLASSPEATSIPTLSEWAQLGMVALLVGGGLLALRRRLPN